MSGPALKGFVITAEALMITVALIIVGLAAYVYASKAMPRPAESRAVVEASLCGRVLTIVNVGSVPATIQRVVYGSSDFTSLLTKRTLNPGESVRIYLSSAVPEVAIVGVNFDALVVKAKCGVS